jgi:8-oxo-dGTP diphosphatase
VSRETVQIVAALVRRDGELLMVRQGGSGEEPHWSIPSGRVEPGESALEALARELREETGVSAGEGAALAFTAQVDDPRYGYAAAVWTFELPVADGEPAPRDPDGLVLEAAFVPIADAVRRLAEVDWQGATVAYLRGELEPGSLALRGRNADGVLETVAVVAPAASAGR